MPQSKSDDRPSQPIRVFLSYAAEDSAWKDNFVHGDWFGSHLRNPEIFDYRYTGLPFGQISEELGKRIASADAIIAFLSRDYICQKYTVLELELALAQTDPAGNSEPALFVPVIMDNQAREWWRDKISSYPPGRWLEDHAFRDFRNALGTDPLPIVTAKGLTVDDVIHRIREVARLIAQTLKDRRAGRDTAGPGEPNSADKKVDASTVVVLGHPTALHSERLRESAAELAEELTSQGVPTLPVRDEWLNEEIDLHSVPAEEEAHKSLGRLLEAGALFVQPVASGEAREHAANPDVTLTRLRLAAESESATVPPEDESQSSLPRIVLWLPRGQSCRAFEAKARENGEANPAFRIDPPGGLAAWIAERSGVRTAGDAVPVLALEEWTAPRPSAHTAEIRAKLKNGIEAPVRDVLKTPPRLLLFSGELLRRQFQVDRPRRAIVAVNDLNTNQAASPREAKLSLEQKLGQIETGLRGILDELGEDKPDIFRVALLAQHGRYMPYVKYPDSQRFEAWCLLPFTDYLEPDHDAASIFRTYLTEWASAQAAVSPA
jgi:hypothetical protein